MLLVIFFLLNLLSSLYASPINRVVVYDNYTMPLSITQVGCITSASNTTNIRITLFSVSLGNYTFCITDEGGYGDTNFIEINTVGLDKFYPGGIDTTFIISRSYTSACFYSDGIRGFHRRIF